MGEGEEQQQMLGQPQNSDVEVAEATQESQHEYTWPVMRFDVPPHRTYHFHNQFRASSVANNFLKGIKWSPDGSCFMTSSEDNTLSIFSLPENGISNDVHACSLAQGQDSYKASLAVKEGESIYDFCWFPYMSVSDPVSCVFASTTRDHPIHLWDSTTGLLRCTYRAYDAVDEITAAFSVAFNPAGTKIFAGYNKSIRVFDIHRPGRDFEQYSTLQGNKEGQAGIISAVAFSPTHTGMLATGSYSQTSAIYREDNMELLYVLHGQEGGITHVQFSRDGNYLYTGGRKDPYIMCWDLRKAVQVVYNENLLAAAPGTLANKHLTVEDLILLAARLYRSSEHTNQRIFFDVDPSGRHLGTGGQDGLVHIYDLQTGQWVSGFQAAADTVNGFSYHPFLPMAATSSGHRRFPDDDFEDLHLKGDENCVSVWSFSYESTMEDTDGGQSVHDNLDQDC